MIPTTHVLAEIGATSVAGAVTFGAVVQSVPDAAQNWTAMALLSALVLGIGGWLVKTLEKTGDRMAKAIEVNTAAQAEQSKQVAMLALQVNHAHTASEAKGNELAHKLEQLHDRVAQLKP